MTQMLQKEKPMDNEVTVSLLFKDLKYGNNNIVAPEATTIFDGRKITLEVPFAKRLDYKYKLVEDPMIFKFAITSSGDLLGFLYLEIP